MIQNEIILNTKSEYENSYDVKCSVSYFIVARKNQYIIGSNQCYEQIIAGKTIIDWVKRACINPTVVYVSEDENEFKTIASYINSSDVTVILNANIPLIQKEKLNSVIKYFISSNMNVLRLKAGYIFRTNFLRTCDTVINADIYNLKSYDFFEVCDSDSLNFAKSEMMNHITKYYSKNGVNFEDELSAKIDAGCKLCYGTYISDNVRVLKNSFVGENSKLCYGTILSESNIGENVNIDYNCLVRNSEIKDNSKIGVNVNIINCKIGNNCQIKDNCKIIGCEIGDGVVIEENCEIIDTKIESFAIIGKFAKLLRANIEENFKVFDGKIIIIKSEEKK